MKAKRLILAAFILTMAIGILLLLHATTSSSPVFALIGYEHAVTNDKTMAKFELRNTTGKTIWLCCYGSESPLPVPLLKRQRVVAPKSANGVLANINGESFFSMAKPVLPGDSVHLEFPLQSGEPPEQMGITYYFGNFSDGDDFLTYLYKPALNSRADFKEKAHFYWHRFRRWVKGPERHEVWCVDLVSFQEGITNSPPK